MVQLNLFADSFFIELEALLKKNIFKEVGHMLITFKLIGSFISNIEICSESNLFNSFTFQKRGSSS